MSSYWIKLKQNNFYAFNLIFIVDVNDILKEDYQLIISVIHNICQDLNKQKLIVDRNFAKIINNISTVHYWVQNG